MEIPHLKHIHLDWRIKKISKKFQNLKKKKKLGQKWVNVPRRLHATIVLCI
jgi:hypothetical protein